MDESTPEVSIAIQATTLASALCQEVRRDLAGRESIQKNDRSPVTVADFGSQAIVCKWIRERFPDDIIVAEEDSSELKKPDRSSLLAQVTRHVKAFVPEASPEEVCAWIDFSSQTTSDRFWTLDPIDGTKGFLRGDQYAIALALIEHGSVKVGVVACPSLYVNQDQPSGKRGCLFLALRGRGSFQMDMEGGGKKVLSVSRLTDASEATFTESVEPDHADHLIHERLAHKLGISKPPLKMDSQAKYGIVARGEATFYLRIPSPSEPAYQENIWDHAAGSLIAEEAGGRVTDTKGRSLDFSSGIKMRKNYGIVVTNGRLHEVILKALNMG